MSATTPARLPPHSVAAEESLLGAMLLSRDAIAEAVEVVSVDHFYKPAHGHIFEAISALYSAGEPADTVTVAEAIDRAGLLAAIGGPEALVSIQTGTPAATNAAKYARIVEEHALLRALIAAANDIAELGYSAPDDVIKAVDEAEARIYQIARGNATDTMAPLSELVELSLDRLEQLYERGDTITGTPTGYQDLDVLVGGLQPEALIVVGARPAMGKTSFALGATAHAALAAGQPVLFFSLEMSQLEITERLVCWHAKVDTTAIRNGYLREDHWARIASSAGALAEAPIWIDDSPSSTVTEIRAKARRLASRVGQLGLLVVDYLQLMTGRSSAENRQVEVAEISRGLKVLARELHVPVMALSHLSRNLEQRSDKRPVLADLRESGSIEQDSDVVLLLYRDELYHRDSSDAGVAEVHVAKHRTGPTGTVRLAFLPRCTRFANMSHRTAVA